MEHGRVIDVAAAVIENDAGELLIARRKAGKSQAGLWEFPGGKLEEGESPEACIRRELQEEMGIEVEPYASLGVHEHAYPEVTIRLIACRARLAGGTIALVDHDAYRWVNPGQLFGYAWAPADIPFVEQLVSSRADETGEISAE